jgi:hypothetical protein
VNPVSCRGQESGGDKDRQEEFDRTRQSAAITVFSFPVGEQDCALSRLSAALHSVQQHVTKIRRLVSISTTDSFRPKSFAYIKKSMLVAKLRLTFLKKCANIEV